MIRRISLLLTIVLSILLTAASCSFDLSMPTVQSHEQVDESSIDVDLSSMSGTVVYSAVFDMLNNPDEYRGKTIRMRGQFMVYNY